MNSRVGIAAGILIVVLGAVRQGRCDPGCCTCSQPYFGSAVDADYVLVVHVQEVVEQKGLMQSIGDWAWLFTGSRLGFPSARTETTILRGSVWNVLKGSVRGVATFAYQNPPLEEAAWGFRRRLELGKRYLILGAGTPGLMTVKEFVDLESDPGAVDFARQELARDRRE